MTSTWLKAGVANLCNIDLEVGQEPPSNTSVATIKWKVEVIVDVAQARDIKKHQTDIFPFHSLMILWNCGQARIVCRF